MAASSSSSDWSKAVDRWGRVCDLGMKAALREAGCSEQSIVDIIRFVEDDEDAERFVMGRTGNLIDTERSTGAIYATLGRGITRVNTVWLDPEAGEGKEWSAAISPLCVNLSSNTNILRLCICFIDREVPVPRILGAEVSMLGHALATNSSLTDLDLGYVNMGVEGVRCLLHELQANKKLEVLSFNSSPLLGAGLSLVAEFLRNNTTLKELDLSNTNQPGSELEEHTSKPFLPTDWKELFVPALKENTTLRVLNLNKCDGLTGEDVFAALLDLIQNSNTGLEEIHLSGTGLQLRSGQVHEELRINNGYRSRMKGQPQMATTALSSSSFLLQADWSKAVDRWGRVCDLGMEAALREAGCSEQSICQIISFVENDNCFVLESMESSPYIRGKGELFATIGRGITCVNEVFFYLDSYDEEVLCLDALCVNLSSSTNILKLCVQPSMNWLGTEFMEPITKKILGAQASMLGHALRTNSSLLSLRVEGVDMGVEGVRCLLHELQANKKLGVLSFNSSPLLGAGLSLVAEFLRNNTTLKELDLSNTNQPGSELEVHTSKPFLPTDWKELFFPALKENTTLRVLNLTSCDGLTGEDVFVALLDLIQNSNTGLEEIDLSHTGLQLGYDSKVYQEVRINKEYRSQLKSQHQMATTINKEYRSQLKGQPQMATASTSSSSSDWGKAVDCWWRVCDLDMEAALRFAGCSKQSIVDIIRSVENEKLFVMRFNEEFCLVDTGCNMGTLFATLGRGITGVNDVWLDFTNIDPKYDQGVHHNAFIKLSLAALCVNLSSNTNILRLLVSVRPWSDTKVPFTEILGAWVSMLGHALQTNSSLLSLVLEGVDMGFESVRCLCHGLQANKKLEVLRLLKCSLLGEGLRLVAEFLRNNTTLKELDLSNTNQPGSELEVHTSKPFLPTDWKELFFPALKENTTLRVLNLNECGGLTGEDVFAALLDLIQNSNTGLEEIHLSGTGLQLRSGQVHEELRINREYRSRLKGQPEMAITSGRIVLCGYPFAGKTEISKTMKRIENNPLTSKLAHPFKMVWKRLMQRHPVLQQIFLGRDAYREVTSRTRGFQVVTLHKQPYVKSIWDFAGQKEYYALHDYLFPHFKNSYFLYVCSCRCPPDCSNRSSLGKVRDEKSIKDECEYWMRFLASNSKPGGGSHGRQLPRVRFVLTKTDTLQSPQQIISIAGHVVGQLKKVFKDVLDLQEEVEVINAHSSKDVRRLLRASNDNLEEILAGQKEHDVCQQVRDLLKLSIENPLKPILSLDDFYRLLGFRFHQPAEDSWWEMVLASLNDLGEIIFPKGIDFIVTNPSWFGIDVLGPLINAFNQVDQQSCGLYHNQGFVNRQDMQKHLERSLKSLDLKMATKLIDLMIHLELCFENEPEQEDTSLFVPALFDDNDETAAKGQRKSEWKLEQSDVEHLGRRLECQDRSTTVLTAGFFPRLQVHLRNYIYKKGWTDNNFFEVGRNLIRFVENGVEVIVEYAGDIDDFIDILVRSSKPYAKALEFIEKQVVEVIRRFCASPEGCQGVVLVESVIRPVCVEDLHLCIDRKSYSIRVSKLEDELAEDSDYKHTWRTKIPDAADDDWAIDLLEGKGSHERIGKRQVDLLPEISSAMASGSGRLGGLPKLFYTSIEDVGILRKLETSLNFTKVIPIKLHLLCDHKDGSHIVEGQPGRTVKLNVATKSYDVPLAKLAITLLWAGVGVGAHQVGLQVPQIDSWVQRLFDVPNVSGFDGEMLHEMMNMNAGKPLKPVSKEDVVKALNRYWKVETQSEGLREILKLADVTSFWKDFQLQKVEYIEANHSNKVGWVCGKHYWKGFRQKILRAVPH